MHSDETVSVPLHSFLVLSRLDSSAKHVLKVEDVCLRFNCIYSKMHFNSRQLPGK